MDLKRSFKNLNELEDAIRDYIEYYNKKKNQDQTKRTNSD